MSHLFAVGKGSIFFIVRVGSLNANSLLYVEYDKVFWGIGVLGLVVTVQNHVS